MNMRLAIVALFSLVLLVSWRLPSDLMKPPGKARPCGLDHQVAGQAGARWLKVHIRRIGLFDGPQSNEGGVMEWFYTAVGDDTSQYDTEFRQRLGCNEVNSYGEKKY